MEGFKNILTKNRNNFIEEIQEDVFSWLFKTKVITSKEYECIMSHSTRENRVISLLEILWQKDVVKLEEFFKYIILYYPWVLQQQNGNNNNIEQNKHEISLQDKLKLGGVPPLPQRHICRRDTCIVLRNSLQSLKRGEYVVVYGMRGCGKSTLVSDALNSSSLVNDSLEGGVHWLNAGRENATDVYALQCDLYRKLRISLSSQSESQLLLPDEESILYHLQQLLNKSELRECLLILDDVSSSNVIKALNVGCKILITTHDKSLLEGIPNVKYIRVNEGFTERETLELFSICTGAKNLPQQAKDIHTLCKGFPMTISLISSQLEEHKEDAVANVKRWDFYIKKLSGKDIPAAIGKYDTQSAVKLAYLKSAIKMCIDGLDEKIKKYYQDFALFVDDVNIRPEVLATLWGLDKKEVEDIMVELEKKCLVVRMWNQHLISYVYVIHDLLLDFLKQQLSKSQKQLLHIKLINRYKDELGGDILNYRNTDNNNYILLYLPYHLKEAGLHEEFQRLYLDLRFIKLIITANRPHDILHDFKKYQTLITKNEGDKELILEDFRKFVKDYGVCMWPSPSSSYNNNNTKCDIIQFALQQSKNSHVYKQAIQYVKTPKTYCNRKYFQMLTDPPDQILTPTSSYDYREEITAAIFTGYEYNVLLAIANGDIKLVDVRNNNCTIATYKHHSERVTQMALSKCFKYFVSASDDHTANIWSLNDYQIISSSSSTNARTPSPSNRQELWQDAFPYQRHCGESPLRTFSFHNQSITYTQFSNTTNNGIMPKWLVTTARDNRIAIWSLEYVFNELLSSPTRRIPTRSTVTSCYFSLDDNMLICAQMDGKIVTYETETAQQIYSFSIYPQLLPISHSIVPIPGDYTKFIAFSEHLVTVIDNSWRTKTDSSINNNNSTCHHNVIKPKRDEYYTCADISADGKYVAVAASNSNLLISDTSTGHDICTIYDSTGVIQSLKWSEKYHMLISTYNNKKVNIWNLENILIRNTVKLKHAVFDAIWTKNVEEDGEDEEETLILAALTTDDHIQVFYDNFPNDKILPVNGKHVNGICICELDNSIVYSCTDGSVYHVKYNEENGQLSHTNCIIETDNNYLTTIGKLKLQTYQNKQLLLITVLIKTQSNSYQLKIFNNDDRKSYFINEEQLFDYFFNNQHESLVYTVSKNCVLKERNWLTGEVTKYVEIGNDDISCCMISRNMKYMCIGCNHNVQLYDITNWKLRIRKQTQTTPNIVRFSNNIEFVVVACNNGNISVFKLTEDMEEIATLTQSGLIDVTWSPHDDKLLLTLDKEIVIMNKYLNETEAAIYMSVDKIVCNSNFERFVTVDSAGYLHILRYPL